MAYSVHDDYDHLHDSSEDEAILFDGISESDDESPGQTQHPVKSMQGPFDESLIDSLDQIERGKAPLKLSNLSAEERRTRLLDDEEYNDTYNAKWKDNPDSKYHPLAKIISQIAFGMHLLHKRLAASDEEVIRILQKHIDEVDEFVGRADEDLDMAMVDIAHRINHLKIPLEHIDTFEVMLEDREYRLQTLEGNDNIERIVQKTAILMDDIISDLKQGLQALQDMSDYFMNIGSTWPKDTTSMGLYNAMLANAEGWLDWFDGLRKKGDMLGASLVQLGTFLNEIAKRAGIASRRQAFNSNPSSAKQSPTSPFIRTLSPISITSNSKPLPQDPDSLTRALQDTIPKARVRAPPPPKELSHEEKAKNRQSTMTVKSVKISDKRSSTQTIASAFHPAREKVEKSRKKEDKGEKNSKAARMKQMKQMIPSMPKLPRPRHGSGSIADKFSFSMRTRSPAPKDGTKHSSLDSLMRPKPATQVSYETIRESHNAQHFPAGKSSSPHISIEPASDITVLDRSKSPPLSESSTSSQIPDLTIDTSEVITTIHRPNPSRSSNADSLIPLSPISLASSRSASPAGRISIQADSPPISQQAVNYTSAKGKPKMVEVKKFGHGVNPSLGGDSTFDYDLATPTLPSTRFDPKAPSRTASPVPVVISISERRNETSKLPQGLRVDTTSPSPLAEEASSSQERRIEIKKFEPYGLATPPVDEAKVGKPGLYQERRIEIRRAEQITVDNFSPSLDTEFNESPLLGTSASRPESWASWTSSRSGSDNPKVRARVAEILSQSASQVVSPEPAVEETTESKQDEVEEAPVHQDIPSNVSNASTSLPPVLGLNILSDVLDLAHEDETIQDVSTDGSPETEAPIELSTEKEVLLKPELLEKPSSPTNELPEKGLGRSEDEASEATQEASSAGGLEAVPSIVLEEAPVIELDAAPNPDSEKRQDIPSVEQPDNILEDKTQMPREDDLKIMVEEEPRVMMGATIRDVSEDVPSIVLKEDARQSSNNDSESSPTSNLSFINFPEPGKTEPFILPPVLPSPSPVIAELPPVLPPVISQASTPELPTMSMKIRRKPVPKPSVSTLNSLDRSPLQPTPTESPIIEGLSQNSEDKAALLPSSSDSTSRDNLTPPESKPDRKSFRPPPPPKDNLKSLTLSPPGLDSLRSPYPPDSAYASSMTDLRRAISPDNRPSTSRSMKTSALRSQTKLALFPTPTPSMISLRGAQSQLSLPLNHEDLAGTRDDQGIGEEADSALPMHIPTLRKKSNTAGAASVGKMTASIKKLMTFGRRRTVDVGPS